MKKENKSVSTSTALVRQSNKLLEAPLFKSVVQIKVFFKIIIAISKNPKEEVYWFSAKQLLNEINSNEKNYKALKDIAESMKKSEDINLLLDDGEVLSTLFPNVFIKKAGIIGFQVNNLLKPFIIELSNGKYTQFYFKNIARLKSSYSIRIYELLKQYEKIKNRKISLADLRYFLMIDNDKYTKYNDFKKKTIIIAQNELSEKTDIYFEFEEIKEGKKIVAINFLIFKNEKVIYDTLEDEVLEDLDIVEKNVVIPDNGKNDIKNKLINIYKISEKITNDLVNANSVDMIEKNIAYAENEFAQGKIENFTGYLVNAIKNNYANNVSLFELDNKRKKDQLIKERQLEEKKKELKSKLSSEFSRTAKETFLNSLSDSEKEELIKKILEEMNLDAIAVGMIKKKGLNTPVAGVGIIKNIPDFEARRDQFIADKLKEAGF